MLSPQRHPETCRGKEGGHSILPLRLPTCTCVDIMQQQCNKPGDRAPEKRSQEKKKSDRSCHLDCFELRSSIAPLTSLTSFSLPPMFCLFLFSLLHISYVPSGKSNTITLCHIPPISYLRIPSLHAARSDMRCYV